ncbi:MAG TPA: sigma-70 family RNA polymerase sigma factor [Burkholderiaceae bacterium]
MTSDPTPSAPYGDLALGALASRVGAEREPASARALADRELAETVLWERHRGQRDAAAREALILQYVPYARTVAAGLYRQHVHHETEFHEYVQWATLGLIEALDRYDPARGAKFTTYAYTRIQGAIRNGLEHISERQEQLSLHRRLVAERVEAARAGQAPVSGDVGDDELLARMSDIGTSLVLSFMLDDTNMLQAPDDTLPDGCYEAVAFRQEQRRLRDMLPHLTPREQSVVRMHYMQGMTYDQTAQALRITKGRVAQLHQQALARLRKLLDPDPSPESP